MTTATETRLDERTAALLACYSDAQVTKARKCVAAGGVKPAGYRHEWHVTSSDGQHTYLTTVDACGCHAGQYGTLCWHRAAVVLTYAAKPADCDHIGIDPVARYCRDCGQPVTDEQADAASERCHEQMYGAR